MSPEWRCESCKHWSPGASDVADIECRNQRVASIFGDEGQPIPPDFGCVLWEAK